MRVLPWILVGVLAVLAVAGWLRPRGTVTTTEYVSDTVVVRDTVRDTVPRYVSVATVRRDTLFVPLPADTVRDSIPVIIPIERKEYRTADYRAVVSGYKPSLDYMEVYQPQAQAVGHRFAGRHKLPRRVARRHRHQL